MKVQKNEKGAVATIQLDGTQYHADFGTGGRADFYTPHTPTDRQIASGLVQNAALYKPDEREALEGLQTRIDQAPLPVEITGNEVELFMSAGALFKDQQAQGYRGGMPEAKPFLEDLSKH